MAVKETPSKPVLKDPLDIWVLEDPARNGHGEIVCLRENTTGDTSLVHYVIDKEEMFAGKCDDYILGYRYSVDRDKDGNVTQIQCCPYKDWDVLNTLQMFYEVNRENKKNIEATTETLIDLDYRQTLAELGLAP